MKLRIGRLQIEATMRERRRGRCEHCVWWIFHNEITSGDRGFCRRRSPNADREGRAAWPSTLGHHGCGEFVRKDEPAAKPTTTTAAAGGAR